MLVGAVSFNALKTPVKTPVSRPILETQLNQNAYLLKASFKATPTAREEHFALSLTQKPCTESIKKVLLPRLRRYGAICELVDKYIFLSATKTYLIRSAGYSLNIEIVPALVTKDEWKSRVWKAGATVWCTRLANDPKGKEYWLVDEQQDVACFLKTYFVREKGLLRDGRMLMYNVDCRFEPVMQGWAEHGEHCMLFSKMQPLEAKT